MEDSMGSLHHLVLQAGSQNGLLKSDNFFHNLSSGTLKALEGITFTSSYPKGAILFVEEESPRGVFILSKGRVKLSMTSSEGKSVILRIAEPGEVLGLHAVVSNQPYQASAETLEPCEASFVRQEDFCASCGKIRMLHSVRHSSSVRITTLPVSRCVRSGWRTRRWESWPGFCYCGRQKVNRPSRASGYCLH